MVVPNVLISIYIAYLLLNKIFNLGNSFNIINLLCSILHI